MFRTTIYYSARSSTTQLLNKLRRDATHSVRTTIDHHPQSLPPANRSRRPIVGVVVVLPITTARRSVRSSATDRECSCTNRHSTKPAVRNDCGVKTYRIMFVPICHQPCRASDSACACDRCAASPATAARFRALAPASAASRPAARSASTRGKAARRATA